jgi:hypothetical protein
MRSTILAKVLVISSILFFAFTLWLYRTPKSSLIYAQAPANIQFSVDAGNIYFFDVSAFKVYIYSASSGLLNRILSVGNLGEKLNWTSRTSGYSSPYQGQGMP